MNSLSDRELAIRQRLKDDFTHYAPRCLRIRPKDPRLGNVPFELNKPQIYAHQRLEEQKAKTGKVRALFLKGRQQGMSMTLGVPSGDNGHRLCDVSYELAIPVIKAHIANKEAMISSLTLQALAEAGAVT